MIVEFDKSFEKYLDKIRDSTLLTRIEKVIIKIEESDSLVDLPNVKKLSGFQNYYRIRISDYRIGFEKIDENTLRLIIIAHRKDIYKLFP